MKRRGRTVAKEIDLKALRLNVVVAEIPVEQLAGEGVGIEGEDTRIGGGGAWRTPVSPRGRKRAFGKGG